MKRRQSCLALASVILLTLVAPTFAAGPSSGLTTQEVLAVAAAQETAGQLSITYPLEGTIFPPDIVAPTFLWDDKTQGVVRWHVLVRFKDGGEVLRFSADSPRWRPAKDTWGEIKRRSSEQDAEIFLAGVGGTAPETVRSSGRVRILTSKDEVGDALFYREVPLPFLSAVQDPSRIRWRYGTIDMEDGPPIVLQNLPVCGNCHSFADNGTVLGLDVDYGNDKGAYGILPVAQNMLMNDEKIITWADYKREDGDVTFGLLSRVSPTGRYVISTVKDRSVFVATPEITFSQLFFPIKGILVVYDRETEKFSALPGADDPQYVQSNPAWSPDGKTIVFARSKAHETRFVDQMNNALLDEKDVPEFTIEKKPFRYDLYRIPFNDGRGGVAEPLLGASGDGRSNFFPKYSPDGKWIVFCKADSYMLLQPDSDLYIIPAEGGTVRRLRYNTARMNSWHSWSSNSRWLVFSSKVNTPYTQLFLTHIDEEGNDTPPVLLERFTSPDRAANIPEFVKLPGDAIVEIREEFLDAYSFLRAGMANERTGDYPGAARLYRQGLEIEPNNVEILNALGWTLFQDGKPAEAVVEYERASALDPRHVKTHNNVALALVELGKLEEAASHWKASLDLDPKPEIYSDYGFILARLGKPDDALQAYQKALELDPNCASAHFNLAVAALQKGKLDEAASHYQAALSQRPNAETYNGYGFVLAQQGRAEEATQQFRKAIEVNPKYTPAYNNLGDTLAKQGKLDEAEYYYQASLREKPSAAIHTALGLVLKKLGRNPEAAEEFRKAIALDPANTKARRNLANLAGGT